MKIRGVLILLIAFGSMAFGVNEFGVIKQPNHFPEPTYDISSPTVTTEKILLGRALFYDPILSKDNTISCASCHSPYNAFAHTDHDLSHGIKDQIGRRNAPPLFNLAWQKSFMWDGAVNHLDMQALAPITDPIEMGESLDNVISKLQDSKIYPTLFQEAFGDSTVTGQHTLKAIAQFSASLISANSKYDQVKNGTASFTEQELNGYQLFQKNCNTCHQEPLFSTYEFANNGLTIDTTLNDYGKGGVTLNPRDSLLFKIPSLRNISYTYPYMHDGRFRKLNEVIDHYTNEKLLSPTLAVSLKTPIQLTSNEKVDLIAFLLTLNDKTFVFNKDHQYPREILLQQ